MEISLPHKMAVACSVLPDTNIQTPIHYKFYQMSSIMYMKEASQTFISTRKKIIGAI